MEIDVGAAAAAADTAAAAAAAAAAASAAAADGCAQVIAKQEKAVQMRCFHFIYLQRATSNTEIRADGSQRSFVPPCRPLASTLEGWRFFNGYSAKSSVHLLQLDLVT